MYERGKQPIIKPIIQAVQNKPIIKAVQKKNYKFKGSQTGNKEM